MKRRVMNGFGNKWPRSAAAVPGQARQAAVQTRTIPAAVVPAITSGYNNSVGAQNAWESGRYRSAGPGSIRGRPPIRIVLIIAAENHGCTADAGLACNDRAQRLQRLLPLLASFRWSRR